MHVDILSHRLDVTHRTPVNVTCEQPLASLDSNFRDLNFTQFLHSTTSSAKCGVSSEVCQNVELPIFRHILGVCVRV